MAWGGVARTDVVTRLRAVLAGLTLAVALGAAPALAATGAPNVPLGTSVWWACMQAVNPGPPGLGCPLPYTPRYPEQLATAHRPFDVIVPENELKMAWTQPSQGHYDFTTVDRILAYARDHGFGVRGHVLVYGKGLPDWMTNPLRQEKWTRDSLLAVLKDHITTVMQHAARAYPGVVREWDVVNEAFDSDGGYDRNLLSRVIGPDYVEQAFRFAHAADPGALLFYNDYDADQPGPRASAILRMAKDFIARGVPLDGIGLQMHLGMARPLPAPGDVARTMRSYADLGLRVAVTEMDVGLVPPFGALTAERQQAVYQEVAGDCAAIPACTGLTVWGVADPLSWRGIVAAPLLLDKDYAAKPALAAVQTLLAGAGPRAPQITGPGGRREVALVPVVDTRARQLRATVVTSGIRALVGCPGTPPCTVTLALRIGTRTIAKRRATILTESHTLRLKLLPSGVASLCRTPRSRAAVLRGSVGGGAAVRRPVTIIGGGPARAGCR